MNDQIPFASGDKVVCYVRDSGGPEQTAKDVSTTQQITKIKEFCQENDLLLVRAYTDDHVSGRTTVGRDQFFQMMYDLRLKPKPDIQGVLLWSFSRFARNYDDSQYFKADLRRMGYKVHSMNDKTDDSSIGRLIEAVYDYQNQHYSEQVSADVKRALHLNFTEHKAMPGHCPIGFVKIPIDGMPRRKDGSIREAYRWEPDPDYFPRFRRAFEMRLEGASYSEIHRYLGFYTSTASVKKMFNSKLFYGCMIFGGKVIEEYCTPIVSKEVWERCHALEKTLKKKVGGRPGGYGMNRALLSGFIFCGVCGSPMYINRRQSKGKLYESYSCKNRCVKDAPAALIEPCFYEFVHQALTDESVEKLKEQYIQDAKNAEYKREHNIDFQARLDELDTKMNNLVEVMAVSGKDPKILSKYNDLKMEKKVLEAEFSLRNVGIENAEIIARRASVVRDNILAVLDDPEKTNLEKQDVIKLFVKRVEVINESQAKIYHFLPGSSLFSSEVEELNLVPREGLELST